MNAYDNLDMSFIAPSVMPLSRRNLLRMFSVLLAVDQSVAAEITDDPALQQLVATVAQADKAVIRLAQRVGDRVFIVGFGSPPITDTWRTGWTLVFMVARWLRGHYVEEAHSKAFLFPFDSSTAGQITKLQAWSDRFAVTLFRGGKLYEFTTYRFALRNGRWQLTGVDVEAEGYLGPTTKNGEAVPLFGTVRIQSANYLTREAWRETFEHKNQAMVSLGRQRFRLPKATIDLKEFEPALVSTVLASGS